jgi:hypothetical protein
MKDWEKAIQEGKVLKISPNEQRAASLIKSSVKLLKIIEKIELDDDNGFFILTNHYDIVLESMHALLYKKGYKVLDHVSIGYYIKDILKKIELFNIFDKYRKIRNCILYYGRSVGIETARQAIIDLKQLNTFVKRL